HHRGRRYRRRSRSDVPRRSRGFSRDQASRARRGAMIHAARRRALVVSFALSAAAVHAQSDTTTPPRHLFTWRDGLLAGMFVGATYAIEPLDKAVAERLQQPHSQQSTLLQKAATGFRVVALPGTAIIGTSMYVAGRMARS